jgi:hypothetical protein
MFVKYLLLSILGHILLGIAFAIVLGFMLLYAMGNASSSKLHEFDFFLYGFLALLVLFQVYLYRRKSISLGQKLIVSIAPLIFGFFVAGLLFAL